MCSRNRGSTTIECLLGLIITTILIPIVYTPMRILINHEYFNQDAQDEIALYQLRRIMLVSSDFYVSNGNLLGNYDGEEFEIKSSNHTYLTPGTLIFFSSIDEGYFSEDNGIFYYEYLRNGKRHKRVVAYE